MYLYATLTDLTSTLMVAPSRTSIIWDWGSNLYSFIMGRRKYCPGPWEKWRQNMIIFLQYTKLTKLRFDFGQVLLPKQNKQGIENNRRNKGLFLHQTPWWLAKRAKLFMAKLHCRTGIQTWLLHCTMQDMITMHRLGLRSILSLSV